MKDTNSLAGEMEYAGCNVYLWADDEQGRFFSQGLVPFLEEAIPEFGVKRFWFDRFDARGPHAFALFGVRPSRRAELEDRLGSFLAGYLAELPASEPPLSDEVVRRRHDECRGKTMCAADREEGIAPPYTHRVFSHPPDGYPFWLTQGLAGEGVVWTLLTDLARWSLSRWGEDGKRPSVAAIRWFAQWDRALASALPSVEEQWRYHATTLIMGLEDRLREEEVLVLEGLPRWSGANREVFERLWKEEAWGEDRWPHFESLVRAILGPSGELDRRGKKLLREIAHGVLKQLGLGVAQHVPLVFFAWNRAVEALSLHPVEG